MRRMGIGLTACALLISACMRIHLPLDTVSSAAVSVSIFAGGARTVVPDYDSAANVFDELQVTLTSHDGFDPLADTDTTPPWSVSFAEVREGTWDIDVSLWRDGVRIGSGSVTDQLITADTTIDVSVAVVFDLTEGDLDFAVSVPAITGIDYVSGDLVGAGIALMEPAVDTSGDPYTAAFTAQDVNDGTYPLVLTFRRGGAGGTIVGVFREMVVVQGGFSSNGWVGAGGTVLSARAFDATDFFVTNASLADLVVSDGVLPSGVFESSTEDYVLDPVSGLGLSVTFTATQSVPGQYLRYVWNGGAPVDIASGQTSAALPLVDDPAAQHDNTLEVLVTAPDGQTTITYTVSFSKVYWLSYHANTGSGSVPAGPLVYEAGVAVTVLENTGGLAKPGYDFFAWNTQNDGVGITRLPGTSFAMGNADTVLYAWYTAQSATVAAVTAGSYHTMILKTDGTLWATGRNNYGQLGLGNATDQHAPVQVTSGVAAVAAGNYHTMILKTDGTLWATGQNSYGQLGLGDTAQRNSPVQLTTIGDVAAVTAGSGHTMILKTDGTLWATGRNYQGQLGLGDTALRNSPVQVTTISGVAAVAAGGYHTMILKTDETLWATGLNQDGQLGLGNTTEQYAPVQVTSGVAAVDAGVYHTMILKTDGTLWATGRNSYGQLGLGDTTQRTSPVQVTSGVAAAAAGIYHTMILKTDGTLYATGQNTNGQLGLGDTAQRNSPVQVATIGGVAAVVATGAYTMILKSDGTLYATGLNDYGQLGLGDTAQRTSPVQVTMP